MFFRYIDAKSTDRQEYNLEPIQTPCIQRFPEFHHSPVHINSLQKQTEGRLCFGKIQWEYNDEDWNPNPNHPNDNCLQTNERE